MGGSFASLHLRRWLVGTALLFLVGGIALGLPRSARADGEPSPDPSGLATGDRTSVVDAGGRQDERGAESAAVAGLRGRDHPAGAHGGREGRGARRQDARQDEGEGGQVTSHGRGL